MIGLDTVAARIEYPDTRLEVIQFADPEMQDRCTLVAYCTSPDNITPGQEFTVARGRVVDFYYPDEHSAACVIRDLLHYVACHEVDEKLLCDGNRVFDPHSSWQASVRP